MSSRSIIASITAVIALSVIGLFAGSAKASSDSFSAVTGNGVAIVAGKSVGAPCKADVPINDQLTLELLGYVTHFVLTPTGLVNLGCKLQGPTGYSITIGDVHIGPSGEVLLSENGLSPSPNDV